MPAKELKEILPKPQKSEQKSRCENCGNRRRYIEDGIERNWCRICVNAYRRKESGMIENLVEKTIPQRYHVAQLEHLPRKLQETIVSLPDDKGLMLWGKPGRGKTYSMMASARYLLAEGWDVECISYEMLCSRIRSSYQSEAKETEYEIINSLLNPDKLFIDDVGTTVSGDNRESDFSLRVFLTILDQRMNHCKATFITTNKPVEQLKVSFDERIASRIEEACMIIQTTGEDKRRQVKS